MRKMAIVLVALGLILGACGVEEGTSDGGGDAARNQCDASNPPTLESGVLTVATDKPAFPPWFEGSPKDYSGYEGELASEIAERMNLDIEWVVEPFNKSYAPGEKDYDFDINQISITPEREQAVDFSDGYFTNNQGVLAMEGLPIADVSTVEGLAGYRLGSQVGTTGLDFINEVVRPSSQPRIFDTTNDAKSALESGQIDALVTDVVTTVYLRDFEIKGSEVVGQYPSQEQFGMLFEQGNQLRACVNDVLADIRSDGTLEELQAEWLQQYLSVPILEE
ncbi:MAG: ABC transporter substrate-binding protein [Actinomycetota bacterium]